MNERIRELALKCAQQLDWDPPGDPKEYNFTDRGLNEFAELIVQECLNQCYNRGMNDELYAGQLKAAAYIEDHFGVKE